MNKKSITIKSIISLGFITVLAMGYSAESSTISLSQTRESQIPATHSKTRSLKFSDYPTPENFSGKVAPVNLNSHPMARRFRTVLQQGAQKGPNFAGHYTVVTWGCGTGCQQVAIVDAKIGSVYMLDEAAALGAQFQRNSRLLVINPSERIAESFGNLAPDWIEPHYYLWDGNQLRQLH